GGYRWFLHRYSPLLDEQGGIVRWYVSSFDIENLKQAESALAASEQQLQLVINATPALLWSATPDGAADYFNQHYQDFVGAPLDDLLGWKWTAAVHPDDLPTLSETWASILASGVDGTTEARLRREDGEYRWFLFHANPLKDPEGKIIKWYGVNTDIEER